MLHQGVKKILVKLLWLFIAEAQLVDNYCDLVLYLKMARKDIKESALDTESSNCCTRWLAKQDPQAIRAGRVCVCS